MKTFELKTSRITLGEQAYEKIRNAIITLKLKPGQMIYETELAQAFGVSRTPIREAFRMLLSEELIEVLPQRGARIALISEKKVEETRFVRESLEISTFRLVARFWDKNKDHFRHVENEVRQLIEEQWQAAKQNDAETFLQLDEQFHSLILQQAGNSTLQNVVLHMRGHLNRIRYLSLVELKNMERLMRDHQRMIDAIVDNDEESAIRILTEHLGNLNHELPSMKEKYPEYFQ